MPCPHCGAEVIPGNAFCSQCRQRVDGAPAKKGWGVGLIIGLVIGAVLLVPILIAVIGIVAAIAIPSLLRARIAANEAQAIGDIRTVISAEAVYESQSMRYGSLECLANPSTCLNNYTGGPLVDTTLVAPTKGGYTRKLLLPPDGHTFAIVAVPMQRGQTGVRAFCGDVTGVVCATTGAVPKLTAQGCDMAGCTPL